MAAAAASPVAMMRAAAVLTPPATLSITKNVDRQTATAAGQMLTYTFIVWNTGPVPVTGVSVTDTPVAPAGGVTARCTALSSPAGPCSGSMTTLAPNQTATFTGTYTVTTADLAKKTISDTATANGTAPDNSPVAATSNPITVNVAALTIAKKANRTTYSQFGQNIIYTFTVTNTGAAALAGVGVADNPAGSVDSPPTCVTRTNPSATCGATTVHLNPGQVATFTGTHTVTNADLVNVKGAITDSATATGAATDGTAVSANSTSVTVSLEALSIAKTANRTTISAVGQKVAYTFTVTNVGQVPLTEVGVTDQLSAGELDAPPSCTGRTTPTATCGGQTTTLAPGQVATFTATYTVVAADLDRDSISNTAVAQGSDKVGDAITSPASTARVDVGQVATTTVGATSLLAFTGVDAQLYLVIAAVLIGVGFLLTVSARRRRRA
jgi:uncharacterized repeat protein (TIGR01451 family)